MINLYNQLSHLLAWDGVALTQLAVVDAPAHARDGAPSSLWHSHRRIALYEFDDVRALLSSTQT